MGDALEELLQKSKHGHRTFAPNIRYSATRYAIGLSLSMMLAVASTLIALSTSDEQVRRGFAVAAGSAIVTAIRCGYWMVRCFRAVAPDWDITERDSRQ